VPGLPAAAQRLPQRAWPDTTPGAWPLTQHLSIHRLASAMVPLMQ
jgi:hypothetical protein